MTAVLLKPSPQMVEERITRRGECIKLAPVLRISAVKCCPKDLESHIGPTWEMEKELVMDRYERIWFFPGSQ